MDAERDVLEVGAGKVFLEGRESLHHTLPGCGLAPQQPSRPKCWGEEGCSVIGCRGGSPGWRAQGENGRPCLSVIHLFS